MSDFFVVVVKVFFEKYFDVSSFSFVVVVVVVVVVGGVGDVI